jgi:iron(III) transport system ATP-binding protein
MRLPLEVDDLWVPRSGAAVLRGVSLSIQAGEVLALLGPSGAGKTTLVRAILGFLTPEQGAVWVGGVLVSTRGRILRLPEERNLAVVFQDLALWPHLTVYGNLAFGLEARGLPRAERDARIHGMLGRVGLSGKENRRPGDLSGGERQRVAIARALVLEPQAVLLDEPLSNLDVVLRRDLLSFLRELLKERGVPALYVTHDPREAVALADRAAILDHGRVIQSGTLEEICACPLDGFVRRLIEELDGHGGHRT